MTIDRIRINGKYMEEKLKRGFGTNDFINHLNISEEEFFHCLKKTFSTKSYNLICKRIRNNEKKASKLSTKQTTDTEINTESQTVDLEVEKLYFTSWCAKNSRIRTGKGNMFNRDRTFQINQ